MRTVALLAALASAAGAADPPVATFTVADRVGDPVTVTADAAGVVFDVRSDKGIGRAIIKKGPGAWPKAVLVRMRLTGLEQFKVGNGTTALNVSVSSNMGREVRQWKDDKETDGLAADDPLRMTVRTVGADGKPAAGLPPKGGAFEIALPPAFFEKNPDTLTLDWIDFFRR